MLKLLVLPFAAAGLAGWFAWGGHDLRPDQVEGTVMEQMNGSEAGVVTRSVECSGKARLKCVLTSTRGTTLRARIHVDGAAWRADWAPLAG